MTVEARQPSSFRVIYAIGWVTMQEILRDKILYNILIFASLLLGMALLASELTFITPSRVVLDFGFTAVALGTAMVATFLGATIIQKEFERRTVYVALSHPISRFQFVLGKYFGLAVVLVMNWFLISLVFIGTYYIAARGYSPPEYTIIHATLRSGLVLLLLQSLLLGGLSIFFSTFSTTSLSAMIVVGLFLVGNNTSQILFVAAKTKFLPAKYGLTLIADILPSFEYFNLGTKITYGIPVASNTLWLSLGYGLGYVAVLLLAAGFLIRAKEV